MKRRNFLKNIASTGIALPLTMGFPSLRAFGKMPENSPFARALLSSNDRIMIMIRLSGGNDGLNTIIPYTNAEYYKAREADSLAIKAEEVIKLSGSSTMGLHPKLAPLAALWDKKQMAIVQNVGYPNQNLSHFRSTDIWLSGSDANVFENAGWYAKYLEDMHPEFPETMPAEPFAIELGTSLSTTLIGEKNNMGIAVSSLDFIPDAPNDNPVAQTHAGDEELYVREIIRQSNVFSNAIVEAGKKVLQNKVTYPTNNGLAQGLAAIARLIAAGMKTQMYIINVGGYDTHTNQLTAQATLHENFANAVAAFHNDAELFGFADKVVTMTISEFGRRVVSNGTGTDHGSAAPILVFGNNVKGGFYGSDPNLTDLEGPGNIKMQYDFRQVYASVLGQWYGAAESSISPNALPRYFEQIPLFTSMATSVFETNGIEQYFSVGQNYPNPAHARTSIPIYGVVSGMEAELTIATMDGRTIAKHRIMPGQHFVDISTQELPSGNYMIVLQSGRLESSKIMTVVQ